MKKVAIDDTSALAAVEALWMELQAFS